MIKRRAFFVLLLALLPFVGWAQQKSYYGQHVSIKRTTGDSIQYVIRENKPFKPVIKDGQVVWSFNDWFEKEGSSGHEFELKEKFSIANVENFDFRSFEYDELESHKALMEFYHSLDGDNWPHNDNWCSDKPINEWYGVNYNNSYAIEPTPWVSALSLIDWDCQLNSSVGSLPECLSKMGQLEYLEIVGFKLNGNIPDFLGNNYSLKFLHLGENQLSGTLPMSIAQLPNLWIFNINSNQFEGQLPEDFICELMNKLPGSNFNLNENFFTGKIPERIVNHPHFCDCWPSFLISQRGEGLDLSDLKIPAPNFTAKDLNGNTIDLKEEYKKHNFTLLYKWGLWCSASEELNKTMVPVYNAYKDNGFEIIGIHYDLSGEDDGLADYMKDHVIPWNNILNNESGWRGTGEGRDIFSWGGTPQWFLVDQDGTIVINSLMDGYEKLYPYLEEKLGSVEIYTSTDYSRDGEVTTLQTATVGQGVDLVFVGEGFTDKDIEEGTYDIRMMDAMEQFFVYEPYSSLRNRFNVYAVKAVSPNAEFYGRLAKHAIDEDPAKAFEYASKVPNLIEGRPMRVNVIYNSNSGGRSYCMMFDDYSYVALDMEGITDNVINHEGGGHGIGRLLDEYVEHGYEKESLSEDNKNYMDLLWTAYGQGANVDWRSNPTEVKWARFINDPRYADEQIGVYEGSYLYQYGAYRPTYNSMMRYNDSPFNAPSREEIYKRVMKESEGDGWVYDYETFVQFDAAGRQQFINEMSYAGARSKDKRQESVVRTAPPVFVKGTWRDAMKKK
ncbi:MAG: redoxin domain-containing protein [Prevotella sp.]|nr:redoxin domain-containing protein [Prevotella sp.]